LASGLALDTSAVVVAAAVVAVLVVVVLVVLVVLVAVEEDEEGEVGGEGRGKVSRCKCRLGQVRCKVVTRVMTGLVV
jgi:hypothetical protein